MINLGVIRLPLDCLAVGPSRSPTFNVSTAVVTLEDATIPRQVFVVYFLPPSICEIKTSTVIWESAAVVDEDRCLPCEDIVGVEVADGEVVDGGVLGPAGDGGDLDVGAGAGAEPLAWVEVGGFDPLVEGGDPEGVTVGGGDG